MDQLATTRKESARRGGDGEEAQVFRCHAGLAQHARVLVRESRVGQFVQLDPSTDEEESIVGTQDQARSSRLRVFLHSGAWSLPSRFRLQM